MAEEEVVAPAATASPVNPSDCKRKFEDLQPEATEQQQQQQPLESNTDDGNTDAAVVSDEGENKRPRLDENNRDDLGSPFITFPNQAFMLKKVRNNSISHSQQWYISV